MRDFNISVSSEVADPASIVVCSGGKCKRGTMLLRCIMTFFLAFIPTCNSMPSQININYIEYQHTQEVNISNNDETEKK